MVLAIGEIYVPSGADEIRDDFLTDIRLEAINQGIDSDKVPILPGSDWYVLGTALANIGLIQYTNLRVSENSANLLTATGQALDDIREADGLAVVEPSPASGALRVGVIGGGTITIAEGVQFVYPNGKRGQVSRLHLGVSDGDDVDVVAIDTGEDTNLAAGETVRFVSPPLNLETEATVSPNNPLTGGQDEEDDERKRDRILNRRRNIPAGGNWGQAIEIALDALASLQYAFVYPALGGPASAKIVLVKDIEPDITDFSRELDVAAVDIVRAAIHAEFPSPMEIVVQSVTDEAVDVAVKLTLPASSTSGGNGQGWLDDSPWPPANVSGRVQISTVTSSSNITVNASTATAPIAGQTHIAWWSTVDQAFSVRLVTAVSGGAGAWVLTLDQPITDSNNANPTAGEFISPAAVNIDKYGETWRTQLRTNGPGENTSDAARLPRALRHPFVEDEWFSGLTIRQLTNFINEHTEISDAEWSYRSTTTPTVPGAITTAPNILVLGDFGIYEQ